MTAYEGGISTPAVASWPAGIPASGNGSLVRGPAHVLDLLSRHSLNVEQMQNRVFRGGDAAVATIDVSGPVSEDLLADLGSLPDVFGVSAASIDDQAGSDS